MDPSKGGKARAAALSQERRREIARKAAQSRWDGVFGGVTIDFGVTVADLTTGLRVAAPRPGSISQEVGTMIPVARAVNEILALRRAQVGARYAGITTEYCRGRWEDAPPLEPVVECRIIHHSFPGEDTPEEFMMNMGSLAELVAEKLGQEIVWVRIGDSVLRATPPGIPGPEPMSKRGRRIR
jgi:hypothetical protein